MSARTGVGAAIDVRIGNGPGSPAPDAGTVQFSDPNTAVPSLAQLQTLIAHVS